MTLPDTTYEFRRQCYRLAELVTSRRTNHSKSKHTRLAHAIGEVSGQGLSLPAVNRRSIMGKDKPCPDKRTNVAGFDLEMPNSDQKHQSTPGHDSALGKS